MDGVGFDPGGESEEKIWDVEINAPVPETKDSINEDALPILEELHLNPEPCDMGSMNTGDALDNSVETDSVAQEKRPNAPRKRGRKATKALSMQEMLQMKDVPGNWMEWDRHQSIQDQMERKSSSETE